MRSLIAIVFIGLSGCGRLVSTDAADFPGGYATLYTTYNESKSGQACNAGSITYYKRNALADEHWVLSDRQPYFAAPGTYRIAMWCQTQVDPLSGECQNEVYIDWGGPESKVTVEANHSYVIYCAGHGVKLEDRDSFNRSHKHEA